MILEFFVMVVSKVTKYLAVSLVSTGLMFGLAAVAHAEGSVVVDQKNVSDSSVGNSGSELGVVDKQAGSSSSTTQTTIQIDASSNSKTDVSTVHSGSNDGASTSGGSSSSVLSSGTSGPDNLGVIGSGVQPSNKGADDLGKTLGVDQNSTPAFGGGSGPHEAATEATPSVQQELNTQQSLPLSQTATFRQSTPNLGTPALTSQAPVAPATPTPAAPAKDLPIQGALAGINGVLANTLLPLRGLTTALLGAVRNTSAIRFLLAYILVLFAVVSAGRFVDLLKASGYSHAARADVLSPISYLATQSKVSLSLAYVPSYKPTFFGVRNKVLNVPKSFKKGGEYK